MANLSSPLPQDRPLKPILRDDQAVKIVGLGGVGGIVARYGAMFLTTVAGGNHLRLVLIDGDQFELANAPRMLYSRPGNKATVVRDDLLDHFTDANLTMVAIEEFVEPGNMSRLFQNGDIIIASVDNHATRKLLSDYCGQKLTDVVLISGGNDGVGNDSTGTFRRGTYGSCQIQVRRAGRNLTPSLVQHHPELAHPVDALPTDASCTELMASIPQLLLTNLATASAILNALSLHLCGALHYSELGLDIADGLMRPLLPFDKRD